MALTKHQKLARGMKRIFDSLEVHFQKTASMLNVLQFHFFETHLIVGRPLMPEKILQGMVRTHRQAMEILSPNPDLRQAAQNVPLIGCMLSSPILLRSRVRINSQNAFRDEKQVIPWGVKIVLPEETLRKLNETKSEALLYCASQVEMSAWIDWFDREDRASTFVNQLLAMEKYFLEQATLEKNIRRLAMPFYMQSVREYFKTPKDEEVSKVIQNADFAPRETTDIETAYRLIFTFLAEHKKRHFEDFQRFWRDKLIKLMLEGISWEETRQHEFLTDYFTPGHMNQANAVPRWTTGNALDRQTYGTFIRYFLDRFISDPTKRQVEGAKRQVEGEITLLLWIMIYAAHDLKKPITVKKLLALTTSEVSDRYITIDDEEIEVSCGLADLIKDYVGEKNLQRRQKLFPNLTIDKLEDYLHRASKTILPPSSVPALPEAFLTFPHHQKNCRMNAKFRREQQKKPPKILHDTISSRELKRQLIEKSKLNLP